MLQEPSSLIFPSMDWSREGKQRGKKSGLFWLRETQKATYASWPSYLSEFWKWKWSVSYAVGSVAQSCPTLCDPMNCSTPGLPVHHQLSESSQTHVHRVSDAIQPSHLLLSPSPPAPNPSQHEDLFKRVSSSHQVAKVLEFQLQHQSFQWTPRTDLL